MRKVMSKRGLTPVVATILLISIALIIALIIFFWASSFIGEKTIKFDRPVELSCEDVSFDAEAFVGDGTIDVVNRGDVPIYGIEVRKQSTGAILDVNSFGNTIGAGETESIDVNLYDFGGGDNLIIVPIILGESGDYKKAHTCDEDFGKEITVQ